MIDTSYAMLFDFDGTLMDTERAIVESFREIFRRYRTEEEFTKELQVEVLGPSLSTSMKKYFPNEDTIQLENEFRDYQKAHLNETVSIMKHAVELVDSLKEKGYNVGFVSTRKHDSMVHILNLFSLVPKFDVIVGADDVTQNKPSPEGILLACNKLNLEKSVYVGDSATDIQAGKAANSITVAYISNMNKKNALLNEQPDYITDDLLEILQIIK